MEKGTRIKILWAWLVIMAATICGFLGGLVYSPFHQIASPGDMVPIQRHVDFLFCEQVHIDSPGLEFDSYLVYGDLKLDNRKRSSSKEAALFIDQKTYNYFALYLLVGSNLHVKQCVKEFVTLYVIEGNTNYEQWQKNHYCDGCYMFKEFLQGQKDCVGEDKYFVFQTDINVEDTYFIVYFNENDSQTWVDVAIDINRSVFDLTNSSTACIGATSCDIILDGPDQTPVFLVKDYNYDVGIYNHPEFAIKCVPRIWAYCILFGVPVLLIGISFSVLIHKLCRSSSEGSFRLNSERTPLLFNAALPPSYSTVLSEPPKYEDIMRTCEPPPYSDYVVILDSNETENNIQSISTSDTNNEHVTNDSSAHDNDPVTVAFTINSTEDQNSS